MSKIELIDLKPKPADFRSDTIAGLSKSRKALQPIYFYDTIGSQLFDKICHLDEYYPTRTEMAILDDAADRLDELIQSPCTIIEFGSGSSIKIKKLLSSSKKIQRYIPIDISKDHLLHSVNKLADEFPALDISAVCADYTDRSSLDKIKLHEENSKIVFFPGSTIGNLEYQQALELLKDIKHLIANQGKLVLGIDLDKDPNILINAYNDREGVTAAFNLNLLTRINRELGADFQVEQFKHRAIYNENKSRIEMHLVSCVAQSVTIADHRFDFTAGETIHTESSHKYQPETFASMAKDAGLQIETYFTDAKGFFCVMVLTAAPHQD